MQNFWRNKRVLVTGHTGFTGGWLVCWLSRLGAEVFGLALSPESGDCFYRSSGVADLLAGETLQDIRGLEKVSDFFSGVRPDVVFHLAAQTLVRKSYAVPVETFSVNVLGTVNVLEALRLASPNAAAVIVTTDKVYEQRGAGRFFRENDRLGGADPYSSSKACAELAAACYRTSFFSGQGSSSGSSVARIATARAGNIIGGGDWAAERLVPDCIRGHLTGTQVVVRNPDSVRPWQHVLNAVYGYMALAQKLVEDPNSVARSYNFGPSAESHCTVGEIVSMLADRMQFAWTIARKDNSLAEAAALFLDSELAQRDLGWQPVLSLPESLKMVAEWISSFREYGATRDVTFNQIAHCEQAILERGE